MRYEVRRYDDEHDDAHVHVQHEHVSSCREFDAPFRLTDGWRMKAIPPAEPTAIVGEAASKRCRHPLFFCPDDFGKGKANVMSNEAPQQTLKQPVQPPMQIELQNVKKVYPVTGGEVVALDNISLKIRKGDIFGIIGLSGAGKSTLIRCINRLDTPTEGKILIDGQNVPDMNKQQLRQMRRKVSMIFQQFNLLMQQTVAKNIAYPMECIGVPRAKINARVKELLEVVGLESKAKAYPAQLSGGQRQRVAIARALASDPEVLLCDEATSALDPMTTQAILRLLQKINREMGITEEGSVDDVFTHTRSEAGKRLFGIVASENHEQVQEKPAIRIVFNGETIAEPIVADLILHLGVPLSIRSADVHTLNGAQYGQLLISRPDDPMVCHRAIEYLKERGLTVEEVRA